jgi:hypothetical protein
MDRLVVSKKRPIAEWSARRRTATSSPEPSKTSTPPTASDAIGEAPVYARSLVVGRGVVGVGHCAVALGHLDHAGDGDDAQFLREAPVMDQLSNRKWLATDIVTVMVSPTW